MRSLLRVLLIALLVFPIGAACSLQSPEEVARQKIEEVQRAAEEAARRKAQEMEAAAREAREALEREAQQAIERLGPQRSARRVYVFVEGIGTDLTQREIEAMESGACSSDPTFGQIKFALVVHAHATCTDFLRYSYNEGRVLDDKEWYPNPYTCAETGRELDNRISYLFFMLRNYRRANPGIQFVLIGHSLGGVIALEVTKRIGERDLPADSVAAVITIDSPLNHVSRQNILDVQRVMPALALTQCVGRLLYDSSVGRQLGDVTDQNRDTIRREKAALVTAAQAKGVRFMTVGNEQDCLWNLNLCKFKRHYATLPASPGEGGVRRLPGDWIDDRSTMVIQNADKHELYRHLGTGLDVCNLSRVTSGAWTLPCLNIPHGAALQDKTVSREIAEFVTQDVDR